MLRDAPGSLSRGRLTIWSLNMRTVSKLYLVLALLGGPYACLPHGAERATNASIGGLMAYDLDQCIKAAPSGPSGWTVFDTCEAALSACAKSAKTVSDYDLCSDRVVQNKVR